MSTQFTVDHRPGAEGRPAVVLIPGLFAGGWLWDHQLAPLHALGWPVLRLHEPICALGRKAGSVDRLRADVLRLAREHGYDRFVACGASFGGTVAIDLARHVPDAVTGVVASGVPGFGDGFDTGLSANDRLDLEKLRDWVAGASFHDPSAVAPEYVAALRETLGVNLVGTVRGSRAIESYDVLGTTLGTGVDTLYLWGAQDRIAPPGDRAEVLRAHAATAGVELIDHCGHFPSVERPAAFTSALTGFLTSRLPQEVR